MSDSPAGNENSKKRPKGRGRRRSKGNGGKRFHAECPICGKGIRDLLTAIAWGEGRTPAHFDCILKELAVQEDMQAREKIVYLGAGSFGVVKFRSGSGTSRFIVRKRIQLEEKEEALDWRKKVSKKLKR